MKIVAKFMQFVSETEPSSMDYNEQVKLTPELADIFTDPTIYDICLGIARVIRATDTLSYRLSKFLLDTYDPIEISNIDLCFYSHNKYTRTSVLDNKYIVVEYLVALFKRVKTKVLSENTSPLSFLKSVGIWADNSNKTTPKTENFIHHISDEKSNSIFGVDKETLSEYLPSRYFCNRYLLKIVSGESLPGYISPLIKEYLRAMAYLYLELLDGLKANTKFYYLKQGPAVAIYLYRQLKEKTRDQAVQFLDLVMKNNPHGLSLKKSEQINLI